MSFGDDDLRAIEEVSDRINQLHKRVQVRDARALPPGTYTVRAEQVLHIHFHKDSREQIMVNFIITERPR